MLISRLRGVWRGITLLGTWIASVTGAFIIPLPAWYSTDENTPFLMKFGVFLAAVIAGFLILFSLKNRLIKVWMRLSITFFILFISSYTAYHFFREAKTLPYVEKDIVIGNELLDNNPFEIFKESHGFLPGRKGRMMIILGDPEKAWTKQSIMLNRKLLTVLLFICYLFSAGFMISFCNLIILYREKYAIKLSKKQFLSK
ncbi:MAG: hypothetical protein WBG90_03535 [Saonia sp.]